MWRRELAAIGLRGGETRRGGVAEEWECCVGEIHAYESEWMQEL